LDRKQVRKKKTFPTKVIWRGHCQHSSDTVTAPLPGIYVNSAGAESFSGTYVRITANIRDGNTDTSFMYNIEQGIHFCIILCPRNFHGFESQRETFSAPIQFDSGSLAASSTIGIWFVSRG
jgi:hypothetical protein